MDENEIAPPKRERRPAHPGELLRETVLPALDLTVTAFAEKLGVTRQQVHRILAEESGISTDMALRLGKLCGNGPDLWLNMQRSFDLWESRQRLGAALDDIPTLQVASVAALT